jgi:hypothetical protein
MANTDSSYGLRPISRQGSSANSTGMTEYRIAVANTNPIFHGMAVIPLAAGVIDDLQAAAGGNVSICGVFGGCEYVSSTTGATIWSNYWPGTGADTTFPVKAFVYDDPNQLFQIATSNVVAGYDTEAEVRTAVFSNIAFATGNSGSTATGLSSATADLNTVAATNTLALRVMGIQDDPANSDFTEAGIPLIVRINNHFNAPTGSVAAGTVATTALA